MSICSTFFHHSLADFHRSFVLQSMTMEEQLIQYFSGELTAADQEELLQNVALRKELKSEFIRLQNLHALSQLAPRATDKEEGKRGYPLFSRQVRQRTNKAIFTNILKYVAVAVLLIASTVWITLSYSDSSATSPMNTLYVPAGQRARITLQDGTEVWLNAQSVLKYPARFSGKMRKVEIEGEAFFNVAKDPNRPFVVSSQNISMQVLGTQFNVYGYPDAGYIRTSLLEGSIKVYPAENEKSAVILKPEEQVTVRKNRMTVSAITNPEYLLWKEGIYCFQNEKLIDILEKLQRYYDIQIIVKDPDIFNVSYTGKFRQRDGIDEILRIIRKIQNFNVQKDTENNVITITK